MKLLAVCGSPRKGNTEWMVERVLEGARDAGAETELVLLRKLKIELCRGCLTCETGQDGGRGSCVIKDDMAPLLAKVLEADAIVFGTPVYFYLLSALLKNFMDRTLPIWPMLEGKRVAGVVVAEDTFGQTVENLKTYSELCKMTWVGEVCALGKKPGDVVADEAASLALFALGRKLAEQG